MVWKFLTITLLLIVAASAAAVWLGYDLRTLLPNTPDAAPPESAVGGAQPLESGALESNEAGASDPGKNEPKREEPPGSGRQEEATPTDPAKQRAEHFSRATEALERESLSDAEQHLDAMEDLELGPAERERLDALREQVEELRRITELRAAVAQLAGDDPGQVQEAENLLFERADEALPVIIEALRGEDAHLTRCVMATLGRLKRPEVTLPLVVDVLRRPEQAACWEEAIRQIELTESAGAGSPLLELALTAESTEQRVAALEALSRCLDPPPHTVVALLPLVYADGPELAAALCAARSALVVHNQTDLWLQWAVGELSSEHTERLFNLAERLRQIAAASDSEASAETAQAAREFAVALGQMPAEPLSGVKLVAFGAESDDGRAASVLDGTWDTVDPKLMWRYSPNEPHSIMFDLGSERTVVGVRIWNLNDPKTAAGGWKQVAVYVGSGAAELAQPVAGGTVPQGAGTKNALDYGTTIPVRFARGRYTRLVCESLWSKKEITGLTEVQVLGF